MRSCCSCLARGIFQVAPCLCGAQGAKQGGLVSNPWSATREPFLEYRGILQAPCGLPAPAWLILHAPLHCARRAKDQSTTQASLGFKICGMQVYRHSQGGYWRASKRWCKTLPAELVDKPLLSFAHNGELGLACLRPRQGHHLGGGVLKLAGRMLGTWQAASAAA